MKIRPLGNFKQLGTNITLDSTLIYDAIPASNQPEYIRDGKVFALIPRFNGDDSFLLVRGEYEEIAPPTRKPRTPQIPVPWSPHGNPDHPSRHTI